MGFVPEIKYLVSCIIACVSIDLVNPLAELLKYKYIFNYLITISLFQSSYSKHR